MQSNFIFQSDTNKRCPVCGEIFKKQVCQGYFILLKLLSNWKTDPPNNSNNICCAENLAVFLSEGEINDV
jgi:hypothetical protein